MPPSRYTVLVAAIATVLVACAGPGSGAPDDPGEAASPSAPASEATAPSTPSTPSTPPTTTGEAGNAEVLAFTAPDLEGGTFDASEYAGRDVILWMWAPW